MLRGCVLDSRGRGLSRGSRDGWLGRSRDRLTRCGAVDVLLLALQQPQVMFLFRHLRNGIAAGNADESNLNVVQLGASGAQLVVVLAALGAKVVENQLQIKTLVIASAGRIVEALLNGAPAAGRDRTEAIEELLVRARAGGLSWVQTVVALVRQALEALRALEFLIAPDGELGIPRGNEGHNGGKESNSLSNHDY